MAEGPPRLFLFIQLELPWELGPPDGRYLLRAEAGGEPERVVVLSTLTADGVPLNRHPTRGVSPLRRMARSRRHNVPAEPAPASINTIRATIIDPVSLSAERQAQAWLDELDTERAVTAAVVVLNRVLHAQRIATADPYAHAVSPAQALTIRAGWGEGEQVADGRWLHAVELPWKKERARARRRAAALRADERLAQLLGVNDVALLCEELALRARLDLDQNHLPHAAIELDRAYLMALKELRAEQRQDLAIRISELEQLGAGVSLQAQAAMPGSSNTLDEEVVRHGLERLEAALRARTATGFNR
jgi:hypothetical protein